jgi:hypothetical protein
MMPHRPGQIPKTAALYTYTPNTGRGEFTPRESEVKTERTDPGSLRTFWTPVELGLTQPLASRLGASATISLEW